MATFRLIYFRGCPNAGKAKNLLREAGLSFEDISQDELPSNHPLKNYTSPTVLEGDKIIFGSITEEGSGGCSLDIPTAEQLKARLKL